MEQHTAVVTGGLRGLGRSMALGLAREGCRVLAIGHIAEDVAKIEREIAGTPLADRLQTLVADLRRAEECDRVVAAAETRLGNVDILVNNAGLTFTYFDPRAIGGRRCRNSGRSATTSSTMSSTPIISLPTGWRAASPAAWRRAAGPHRQRHDQARHDEPRRDASLWRVQGGARVAARFGPRRPRAPASVNIVNPGAGANTPGMAAEMRR